MTRLDAIRARLRAATVAMGAPHYSRVEMCADIAWLIEQLTVATEALKQAKQDICKSSCVIHDKERPHCPACVDVTNALIKLHDSDEKEGEK